MIKKKGLGWYCDLLTAYANRSLNPLASYLVVIWLKLSPSARHRVSSIRRLSEAINSQLQYQPNPIILQRIRAQIKLQPAPTIPATSVRSIWILQAVLAILAFVLIWRALPPGIILEWSVQNGEPSKFMVYRAATSGAVSDPQFVLLDEIPADTGNRPYMFTDIRLLPGQTYLYRVEAVDRNGLLADTQSTVGSGLDVLPSQLALLFSGSVVAYVLWRSSRHWLDVSLNSKGARLS